MSCKASSPTMLKKPPKTTGFGGSTMALQKYKYRCLSDCFSSIQITPNQHSQDKALPWEGQGQQPRPPKPEDRDRFRSCVRQLQGWSQARKTNYPDHCKNMLSSCFIFSSKAFEMEKVICSATQLLGSIHEMEPNTSSLWKKHGAELNNTSRSWGWQREDVCPHTQIGMWYLNARLVPGFPVPLNVIMNTLTVLAHSWKSKLLLSKAPIIKLKSIKPVMFATI